MSIVVTHTTPADATFSPAGQAAWDAAHALAGAADFSQGGTNNATTPGAGQIIFSDGSKLISDANLTWDATNGLLVQKNISAPILAVSSLNEGFGAGVTVTTGTIASLVVGHGASCAGSTSVVLGDSASLGTHGSSSIVIGRNASNDGTACVGIGANGVIGNFTYVTTIGDSHSNSHNATCLLGQGMTSVADNELVFGNRGISVPSAPSFRLKGSVLPFTFPLTQETLFRIGTAWINGTESTRTSQAIFYVDDFNAEREALRMEADGAAARLGFFGANAVIQQAGAGETVGFTAGAGTAVRDDSTFTGNVGATAYRISDVVKALKNLGLMAA